MNTDYKSNANSKETTAMASTSPVMLVLSTFKHSDRVVETAMEKAQQCRRLVIVYGHNVNLELYFKESDVGLYTDLKEQCEKETLSDYEQQWKEKVEIIANRARRQGIQVETYVQAKRFTSLCLEVIEKEKPSLIITARSHRPDWLGNFFDSVADHLASHTRCHVIEV